MKEQFQENFVNFTSLNGVGRDHSFMFFNNLSADIHMLVAYLCRI